MSETLNNGTIWCRLHTSILSSTLLTHSDRVRTGPQTLSLQEVEGDDCEARDEDQDP